MRLGEGGWVSRDSPNRGIPRREAEGPPVLVAPRAGCVDAEGSGPLEPEARVIRRVAEEAEDGLASFRRELDGGPDQRAADALPLPGRENRHRPDHPDPSRRSVGSVEVSPADEKVADEGSVGVLGHERAALDPAIGTPDAVDDRALRRLAERRIVDRPDAIDVRRLLGADAGQARGGGDALSPPLARGGRGARGGPAS
jgi:hypothetical protein